MTSESDSGSFSSKRAGLRLHDGGGLLGDHVQQPVYLHLVHRLPDVVDRGDLADAPLDLRLGRSPPRPPKVPAAARSGRKGASVRASSGHRRAPRPAGTSAAQSPSGSPETPRSRATPSHPSPP